MTKNEKGWQCSVPGCPHITHSRTAREEKHNIVLCDSADKSHPHYVQWQDASYSQEWIDDNVINVNRTICTDCDQMVAENDYLCASCREQFDTTCDIESAEIKEEKRWQQMKEEAMEEAYKRVCGLS